MYNYSTHTNYTRYDSLQNARIFITGDASGIGASLVEAFTAQGAAVAFIDIGQTSADELCAQLIAQGLNPPWFQLCDVSNIEALRSSILAAQTALGDITVLINNAANDQRHDARKITEQQWLEGLTINLHPAFFAA